MTIKSHQYSRLIHRDEIDFMELFTSLEDTRSSLAALDSAIDTKDFDEIFDAADQVNIDYDIIKKYGEKFISLNNILNHFIYRAMHKIDAFREVLQDVYDLTSDTLDEFQEKVKYVCGIYATIMFFDFNLNNIDLNEVSNSEIEDCAFYTIGEYNNEQMQEFIGSILEEMNNCKQTLGLFTLYPELEEPFMKIVGPELCLINEDYITIEDVQAVINGEISPEELAKLSLERETGDMYDESTGGVASSNIFN